MLEGQVFGGGQCQTRRDQPLDSGVVGEVHEQHRVLQRTGALEVVHEEVVLLSGDAHGAEHDDELLVG